MQVRSVPRGSFRGLDVFFLKFGLEAIEQSKREICTFTDNGVGICEWKLSWDHLKRDPSQEDYVERKKLSQHKKPEFGHQSPVVKIGNFKQPLRSRITKVQSRDLFVGVSYRGEL